MDQLQAARRSASHETISRGFAPHGGTQGRLASHPFPRPLRSVNENTTLLPSPGPLESMLKTTTETGDIGLFSIKPVSRSSASLRSKRSLGSMAPLRSTGNSRESTGFADDRRRLPSYRDITSEILSMYGSESQRSLSSSLSPPLNEMGVRSYSLTSCGSRAIPNKISSATLQSQSSGTSFTQRPRSPFPYPTRLRRPGIRPASPALTENGSVDYSRMIEIERVSHRTVYGSYKPTYPLYGRRPSSGHSRNEAVRYGQFSLGYNPSGPLMPYAQQPAGHGQWENKFRTRLGSNASDVSLRTSSLTSIVNMYQRTTTSSKALQNSAALKQTTGAFYYDYSEDFERLPQRASQRSPSAGPFAPTQTRGAHLHRPMALSDDGDARLGDPKVAHDTTSAEFSARTPRNATNENPQSSRRALLPISGNQQPRELDSGSTLKQLHRRQLGLYDTKGAWESGDDAVKQDHSMTESRESRRLCKSGAHKVAGDDTIKEARIPVSRSLDSSQFVGLPSTEKDEAWVPTSGCNLHKSQTLAHLEPVIMDELGPSDRQRLGVACASRHRRRVAPLMMRTGNMCFGENSGTQGTVRQSITPILSPKPISPARELRVKNSIPQFMKALPPLPGTDVPPTESTLPGSSTEDLAGYLQFPPLNVSRLSTPRSATNEAAEQDSEGATKQSDEIAKWKIKLKPVHSHESLSPSQLQRRRTCKSYTSAGHVETGVDTAEEGKPAYSGRGKLRLKLSRVGLTCLSRTPEESGTVRRRQLLSKSSGSLTSQSSEHVMKLFTPRKEVRTLFGSSDDERRRGPLEAGDLDSDGEAVRSAAAQSSTHTLVREGSGVTQSRQAGLMVAKGGSEFEDEALGLHVLKHDGDNSMVAASESGSRQLSPKASERALGYLQGRSTEPSLPKAGSVVSGVTDFPPMQDVIGPKEVHRRSLRRRLTRWVKTAGHAIKVACRKRRGTSIGTRTT